MVIWAPTLSVAQDLLTLSGGFKGLGDQFSDSARLVGGRRTQNQRGLDELSRELAHVAAQAVKLL